MTTFERELRDLGVILTGHFVFSSGTHSEQFAHGESLVANHPTELQMFCRRLYGKLTTIVAPPDVVVGPDRGGVVVAAFLASLFSAKTVVALKDGKGGYIIDPRFSKLLKHQTVLLADDVGTTLGTLQKVANATREAKGRVIASCVLWAWGDKTNRDAKGLGPIVALGEGPLKLWTAEGCAKSGHCSKGIKINLEHGHGKEFVAKYGQPKN
ncbi:MAG TPA: phosphoribosyltransferase family protein [Candidatus Paceibacterota bacterium]